MSESIAELSPDELDVPELPKRVLHTYARLWQLETWLRRMVYVELRAAKGNAWLSELCGDSHRQRDLSLTHMPTPERDLLSYMQLPSLCKVIEKNWELFGCYLPPKSIWMGKLEEIIQIRHRVAHFRKGHVDDLNRVRQFLRDIDHGAWVFCTSYNNTMPLFPKNKYLVTAHFYDYESGNLRKDDSMHWILFGYQNPSARLDLEIEMSRRPWVTTPYSDADARGYVYHVLVRARRGSLLDYRQLLRGMEDYHDRVIHFCLESYAHTIRLTIPAVSGPEPIIEMVERLVEVASCSRTPEPTIAFDTLTGSPKDDPVQDLAEDYGEHVLGPRNPLTFLDPDMPCSMFCA